MGSVDTVRRRGHAGRVANDPTDRVSPPPGADLDDPPEPGEPERDAERDAPREGREGRARDRYRDRDRGERDDRSWLGDYARRVIKAGADAIMDRDKLIERFVPELPREMAAYLLRVGEDVRDDIIGIFGRELRRFLETLNLTEELQKILTSTSFEIKTEIRFIPNDQSVLKSLRKTKVRVKRRTKDGTEEVVEERETDEPADPAEPADPGRSPTRG